jgi:ATP-dependent Lon protease
MSDDDINMLPRKKRCSTRNKRKINYNVDLATDLAEAQEYSKECYDEPEFNLMKLSIAKNILELVPTKKTKLNSPEVEKIVNQGINNAFEDFDKQVLYVAEDLEDPLPKNWKLGLSKTEIKKYEKELKAIYSSEPIKIKDILESSLSSNDKVTAISLYKMLQNTDSLTSEYIIIKQQLEKVIKYAKEIKYTKEEMENFKNMEEKLKQILLIQKPLKYKILEANIADEKKAYIYERYLQYELLDKDSTTAHCIKEWIDETLKIPFNKILEPKQENISDVLVKIKKGLDEKLYGMEEVKEQLLCILNNKLSNPNAIGLAIAMVGSPGTGKTEIAKSLSHILDIPFSQISLGGMVDSSILDGQHKGWTGSAPGMMVKILQQMKISNGIVLFDEIDKLGETPHGKEVQYALLHITDFVQNKEFHDHYIGPELSIDLSKLVFIYAMNKIEGLDPALLSRLPVINVQDYKTDEKIQILIKYTLPFLLKNLNLQSQDVILSKEAALHLINKVEGIKGKEGGIRGIKDALSVILNKINILLNLSPQAQTELGLSFKTNLQKPVNIDSTLINNLYVNKNKNECERDNNHAYRSMYV